MSIVNTLNTTKISFSRSILLTRGMQFILDATVLGLVFYSSYLLRFDFVLSDKEQNLCLSQILMVIPIQMSCLWIFGVYKQIWRYVSISEANTIIFSILSASFLFLVLRVIIAGSVSLLSIPISIIILNLCFASVGLISIRVLRRITYEKLEKIQMQTSAQTLKKKSVLLIGAGRAGVKTLAEIKTRGDMGIEVIGFIDDDPLKKGAAINGVKILGNLEQLSSVVKKYKIDHVIISIAQTSNSNIKRIINHCQEVSIRVRTIPGLHELIQNKLTFSRIRDIKIEDLLGRQAIKLDKAIVETYLKNKTVMVTGAGGSIGSELVRQIIGCEPKKLLLVDRSELGLFNIERELVGDGIKNYKPLIADICNERQMDRIFSTHRPQVIFHAAAYKHVPLMEANPLEAIKNNSLGTLTIAELAGKHKVESFVLISTDKAVNPTSIMGASKRVAELFIQNTNQKYETKYSAVRFGNVIGSTGSVIPIFQEQIKKGGPVTVTDPEMRRFFMTIPEASQLVLQAGSIGKGGEIFILDMGEQIKIVDLAKETIKLSGLRPNEDIEIVFKGIRPGEKLYEELNINEEELVKTFHPKIFIGKIFPYPTEFIQDAIEEISNICMKGDVEGLSSFLSNLLPEARIQNNVQYHMSNLIIK